MLPRNVSQSRRSPNLYYPVPVFPSTHVSHIPKSLCFPFLMFASPCAPQFISFPVPIDVQHSLCSPVHMFPPTNSPVSMFPTIPHKCFPFPILPKHVPQSLCSPVPMFPKHVPQSFCSPTSSPMPMFPSPIPQSILFKNSDYCIQKRTGGWGWGWGWGGGWGWGWG